MVVDPARRMGDDRGIGTRVTPQRPRRTPLGAHPTEMVTSAAPALSACCRRSPLCHPPRRFRFGRVRQRLLQHGAPERRNALIVLGS